MVLNVNDRQLNRRGELEIILCLVIQGTICVGTIAQIQKSATNSLRVLPITLAEAASRQAMKVTCHWWSSNLSTQQEIIRESEHF